MAWQGKGVAGQLCTLNNGGDELRGAGVKVLEDFKFVFYLFVVFQFHSSFIFYCQLALRKTLQLDALPILFSHDATIVPRMFLKSGVNDKFLCN